MDPSASTRPALTRQTRKAETRRALVQAAAELFAERGIDQASLDEIAARIGLTKGAVYASFRNKEELIEAVAAAYSQVTSIDALFDPSLGIERRLADLGREAAGFMPRIRQLSLMLHLQFDLYLQRHPEKAARERRRERDWHAEQGRRLDDAARERGEPLPLSGEELHALLLGMVRGIGFEWMRVQEPITAEGVATIFALLGRGIHAWSSAAAGGETPQDANDR